MIVVVLFVLPKQVKHIEVKQINRYRIIILQIQIEHVVRLLIEKRSLGEFDNKTFACDKHIVVCSGSLNYDFIFHFLNEFYKSRKNMVKILILFFSNSTLISKSYY